MNVKFISGDQIQEDNDYIIFLTHILADFNDVVDQASSQSTAITSTSDFTEMWNIKAKPWENSWNMRYDNTFDAYREIFRVKSPRQIYVELTSSSSKGILKHCSPY